MRKFVLLVMMVVAFAVNGVMGATMGAMIGVSPWIGSMALNVVGLLGIAPSGVVGAGVFTEVWTGYLNKKFKLAEESVGWYNRIRSFDQYVENDVIHFVNLGGNPEVLVNNTTYPIGISSITDADKPIGLDKFQTKRTIVSDDVLHAISYDKMAVDIERHKDAIEETKYNKSLHAIAPDSHDTKTPVLESTGATVGARKRLTKSDIIRLKSAFDKLRVPLTERILVLCPDHVEDLLLEDKQAFSGQYYDAATGRLGRQFGFDIYEYVDAPYYGGTSKSKLAFGALPTATDMQASIAFAATKCMRADGSLKMYYKESKSNPDTQASEVNFRKYQICLPFANEYRGALLSAKV